MIFKEISCCFTGHRKIVDDENVINKKLVDTIEKLVDFGAMQFYCGGAVGFDMLAGECVLELKKKHRHIKLIMVLPCKNQDKYFSIKQKQIYHHLIDNADEVVYTHDSNYVMGCMHKRNRYMVDNSSYCICYIRKNGGGTKYTLNYAKKSGTEIICI